MKKTSAHNGLHAKKENHYVHILIIPLLSKGRTNAISAKPIVGLSAFGSSSGPDAKKLSA